jgi:hypothetical protein
MALSSLSNLDVVVVPAEHLAGLESGQKFALGDVVGTGGKQAATDKIDSVVMRQVHGGPPEPSGVDDEQGAELGESVAHEQGFDGGASRVQRGESTEDHGRSGEGGGVQVDTKELINRGETSGRALHRVVGRSETVHVLIPGRRAGEEELDHDTSQVHVTESSCKGGSGSGRAEEEHETRADKGSTEMGDAVRQPCEDIESDGLVSREDVAQVCAVEDVFESGQHADPDRRSVFAVDESVRVVSAEGREKNSEGSIERRKGVERKGESGGVLAREEEDEPCGNWQEWQEELAGDRQQQRQHQQRSHSRLDHGTRRLDDAEGKDADDSEEEVLRIVDGPVVVTQRAQRVSRVEAGLQFRDGRGGRLSAADLGACAAELAAQAVRQYGG